MYWPDTGTGVDTEPARKPVASAVRKYFTEGGAGVPPTVPGGDWFNAITNEVLNVLDAAGIDPSKTDDDQLLLAIQRISKAMSAREALRRTYAEAGFNLVPGSFELGGTVTTATDVLLYEADGHAYNWDGVFPVGGKVVPQNSTPATTGGVGPDLWLDQAGATLRDDLALPGGSQHVGFEQEGAGSDDRTLEDKAREWVSVEDKGGVGDDVADNAAAFAAAAIVSRVVKVGAGVFFSSVAPTAMLFSDRGGSVRLGAQVYKLSTVPQVISPYEQTEPDGTIVRLSNMTVGQDCAPDMANGPTSYANTLTGTSAGKGIVDNVTRLTGYGGYICKELILGYSIDAFGTNSCEWMGYGDRITLVGANSGKNLGNANPVGRHEYFKPSAPNPNDWDTRWPAWRTFAGAADAPAQVMTAGDYENKATHIVGVGRNTFGFSITIKDSVALGYDAGTSVLYGQDNVFIGDRAGQWTIKCDFSTWGGSKAARALMDSNQDSGWGYLAGANYVRMRRNTISGYQVMAGFQCNLTDYPESNCFYGRISAANAQGSIKYNCGYGENTLTFVQSDGNVANGQNALSKLADPLKGHNTASGMDSMVSMQDLSPCTSVENSSGFGYQARVSGDNQVQLGNSATTTYVFGTVQNRSDARDKADLRPTTLLDEFIDGLEAEEGFWDMRDDYFEEYQVQIGIDLETAEPIFETRARPIPKDGSKKRNRRHQWFVFQKVQALCEEIGIDFGGLQDHSVNGGCDVGTLGYDEFIPPLTAYVQRRKAELRALEQVVSQQAETIKAITERLDKLSPPAV
ncbi:hypothetical protein [Aeromonas veronii]|uniref:Peptidase S74 domain-containing protein n=1 Tax=Aeromonas veronii AMC34 TaxID=1073383 RepID=K1J8P7_AERVE|nr:hypothetical protein [Aeromonas veronii]EKB22683.1 hypothetical protein HMPREF1168_00739 [Aeromonas veronii AMC34]